MGLAKKTHRSAPMVRLWVRCGCLVRDWLLSDLRQRRQTSVIIFYGRPETSGNIPGIPQPARPGSPECDRGVPLTRRQRRRSADSRAGGRVGSVAVCGCGCTNCCCDQRARSAREHVRLLRYADKLAQPGSQVPDLHRDYPLVQLFCDESHDVHRLSHTQRVGHGSHLFHLGHPDSNPLRGFRYIWRSVELLVFSSVRWLYHPNLRPVHLL
mmetsp:Transcript_43499/g.85154  ORF Transcript_43499/g.85154 Transcript_43499/m.85154 type:complete len:211 (+) Transcript_43499:498-1130(+)